MSDKSTARRLHHVALEVSDLDKSLKFYRNYLGMRLTERHTSDELPQIPVALVFIRLHSNHHDMVLVHDPQKKYRAPTEEDKARGVPPGIHHFAFEFPDRASWLQQLELAKELGIEVVRGPVVHSPYHPRGEGSWGESESFYVLDPDGHRVEAFCDMSSIGEQGEYIDAYGNAVEGPVADEI